MAHSSWALVVHAGAGQHGEASESAYRNALRSACLQGREAILRSEGPLRACVAAVAAMEDDPICNAGVGSNLTEDGTVECDASVMDGANLTYGSCAACSGVRNPVKLAERLLTRQGEGARLLNRVHPMMLSGEGARRWAEKEGIEVVEPYSLVTARARSLFERYMGWLREEEEAQARVASATGDPSIAALHTNRQSPPPPKRPRTSSRDSADTKRVHASSAMHAHPASLREAHGEGGTVSEESVIHDTVGAVCCDGTHLAAAVSSGGVWLKHSGRIGEAALFGAGCWAADVGTGVGQAASDAVASGLGVAASVSGVGEQVMRALLAETVCRLMRSEDMTCHDAATRLLTAPSTTSTDTEGHAMVHAGPSGASDVPSAGLVALRCRPPVDGDPAPHIELVAAHNTPSFAVGYIHSERLQPEVFISRLGADADGSQTHCAVFGKRV